jgi:sortase (surface protein transpeptidase)
MTSLACGSLVRPLVTVLVLGLPAVLLPGLAVVSRAEARDTTAAAGPQRVLSEGRGIGVYTPEEWRWVELAATVRTKPRESASDVVSKPLERATPAGLVLPAIGVDAPVVPVGLDPTRQMEVPDDVATVGWYEPAAGTGVVPGRPGTAVLAGHVNSLRQGRGAFAELAQLAVGDEVIVGLTDGQIQSWSVISIERHPKDRLPLDELFVWDGPPRLVLVTCGGTFDPRTRSHRDNIVVVAVPHGTRTHSADARSVDESASVGYRHDSGDPFTNSG